jgi:pimeloyl-ACP methyl ester carboxylesterase
MRVLLVHGIFMRPVVMSHLAKYLRRSGHEVHMFAYPLYPDQSDLKEAFLISVESWQPDAVVGHSMGGVLAVNCLNVYARHVRTVICLGSPLRGSAIAQAVAESRLSFLISPAAKKILLEEKTFSAPSKTVRTGLIAGTRGTMGFHLLFPVLQGAHDGTVAVSETQSDALHERIEMDVGHTSMLFSKDVARQVIYFLKSGCFIRQ